MKPLSPAPDNGATSRASVLMPCALVAAIVVAYSNSLNVPFVYDDLRAIVENQSLRPGRSLSELLFPHGQAGTTVSGRPLLNVSFALNYLISGASPWSYHVVNVLIHAANACLIFGLGRRTLRLDRGVGTPAAKADIVALCAAALWALHPLQTQAVTYTVQRAESQMAFFYLLTLYAVVRSVRSDDLALNPPPVPARGLWSVVAVTACWCGIATKEVAATAPLLVFLYDRIFLSGSFRASWRARRPLYLGLATAWLWLAALLATTGANRGGTVGWNVGVAWWAYGLTQFRALVTYVQLWLWPHPLTFDYGTEWVRSAGEVVPYAAVLAAIASAVAFNPHRRGVIAFLACWFFGILAPTSLAPGTIQMVVEHRPYLSTVATAFLAAVLLFRLPASTARVAAAGLIAALAALTWARNSVYHSEISLWRDTVAKRPNNARAHEALANAYTAADALGEALAEHKRALQLEPQNALYWYNFGVSLAATGKSAEAIRAYEAAAALDPTLAVVRNNLAITRSEAGDAESALADYAAAEKLRPGDSSLHNNHGLALFRLRRFAPAIEQFELAHKLDPASAAVELNLGTALAASGRMDSALPHFRRAVVLAPENNEARSTLGRALLASGDPSGAKTEFEAVLLTAPEHPAALFGLGAIAASGDRTTAVKFFEKGLRSSPNDDKAHYQLGNVLLDESRPADAVVHYEAALRLGNQEAETHHNLGVALAQLERYSEARREFETAVRLKPNYPQAQKSLEQVRRLTGR